MDFIKHNRDKPFFLYFATHDIHVPRVPHPRFRGATKMGPRGDAIAEFDWSVGQVLKALDELKLADNTLVILPATTAQCSTTATWMMRSKSLAPTNRPARSAAARAPLSKAAHACRSLLRWPKHVPAGATSDALICQIDLLASLAALTNQKLPNHAAPDSVNVLPALLGESQKGRELLVEQARNIALRQKNWKYIEPAKRNVGGVPKPQLYNLADDLAEQHNLASQRPEKVKELSRLLDGIRKSGRMPLSCGSLSR